MARAKRDEVVVSTLTAVQRFFDKSETTVHAWKNQGMPVREDGRYSLKDIYDWYRSSGKMARVEGAELPADAALQKQKLEIDIASRRLKYNRELGALVDREAAKAAVTQLFHKVRTRLLAAPEELGSALPPDIRATYTADARHKIDLILKEMENWGNEKQATKKRTTRRRQSGAKAKKGKS